MFKSPKNKSKFTYPVPKIGVWLLVNLHYVKFRRISHLPPAERVRNTMADILGKCLVCWMVEFCLGQVKHKWFLAWISANRTSVECVCYVICSSVPIQKCSGWHLHLAGWKDSSENLYSKSPWNRNGPALGLVIADGLLHDCCWVQLDWSIKPLKSFHPSHIGENWLNNVKVMQRYQWRHWMCSKEPKQVTIHIILVQRKQSLLVKCNYNKGR